MSAQQQAGRQATQLTRQTLIVLEKISVSIRMITPSRPTKRQPSHLLLICTETLISGTELVSMRYPQHVLWQLTFHERAWTLADLFAHITTCLFAEDKLPIFTQPILHPRMTTWHVFGVHSKYWQGGMFQCNSSNLAPWIEAELLLLYCICEAAPTRHTLLGQAQLGNVPGKCSSIWDHQICGQTTTQPIHRTSVPVCVSV